eukprot:gnl/TRDRNA2_/TRDRNA2_157879_c0_seq1.p1 gnl/TRDRNA2_/TRDRNA2_157879_c0~~gnl/TRDRNA2_/TRDRNA2_157879_c0_seq1.p1  ORF type:complete len:207 (-),score=34.01 gnl/TRDRNA2_/TRDRNA2_157879_c0_seq1:31-651(-)
MWMEANAALTIEREVVDSSEHVEELCALVNRRADIFTVRAVIIALRNIAPGTPAGEKMRRRDPVWFAATVSKLHERIEKVLAPAHFGLIAKLSEGLLGDLARELSRYSLFDSLAYASVLRHARTAGRTCTMDAAERIKLVEGLTAAAEEAERQGYSYCSRQTRGVLETFGERGLAGYVGRRDLRSEHWELDAAYPAELAKDNVLVM